LRAINSEATGKFSSLEPFPDRNAALSFIAGSAR
jgi:hypothetical protein